LSPNRHHRVIDIALQLQNAPNTLPSVTMPIDTIGGKDDATKPPTG
jgi:hypothetical protein